MLGRVPYEVALSDSHVLNTLSDFNPHIAGTPPLGIDMPTSDIDVICHVPNADRFFDALWSNYSHMPGFAVRQKFLDPRPMIASFFVADWMIEIYGDPAPVEQQKGWRHFEVERRLLELGGDEFRQQIMSLRQSGMKTEPAFASALSLDGDPYIAVLELYDRTDRELLECLKSRG